MMTSPHFLTHVINCMNLPFTVQIAITKSAPGILASFQDASADIQQELQRIDHAYSPFQPDSAVVRFQKGDQTPLLDSAEFQSIYALCVLANQKTDGYFDAEFSGHFDPTGLVKGWAIERCFDRYLRPLLQLPAVIGIALNSGGDLQVATNQHTDFQWQIGIENPADLHHVLAIYPLQIGAVATSGISKRGQHIKTMVADLTQVSIVSDHLLTADVWATAGMAAGVESFQRLLRQNQLSGNFVSHQQPTFFDKGVITNVKEASL